MPAGSAVPLIAGLERRSSVRTTFSRLAMLTQVSLVFTSFATHERPARMRGKRGATLRTAWTLAAGKKPTP